jgi:hypothetical protein
MIPQTIKNIAADSEIFPSIPRHLNALEVVAAASVIAAGMALSEEPTRHHFIEALPLYIKSLPADELEAASVVKRDASAVLKIDLATDHNDLVVATRELEAAQAAVAEAEAREGQKLARVHALEETIRRENEGLQHWQIDFDAEEKTAELQILEHWGKDIVNQPFDTIAKIQILRKLAPQAIAGIKERIAAAESELATLAASPKAKRA